ncbi:unnamed protein product [Amoebophrya sp. A120]|nr:unnamed protein product [Amoebophrya sp. A120]|eukprot:GSA120T00011497001.1
MSTSTTQQDVDIGLAQRMKAATLGSCLVALTVTPLEVIKVRMQTPGGNVVRPLTGNSPSSSSTASRPPIIAHDAVAGADVGIKGSHNKTTLISSATPSATTSSSISAAARAGAAEPVAKSRTTGFISKSLSSRIVNLSDGIRDQWVRIPSSSNTIQAHKVTTATTTPNLHGTNGAPTKESAPGGTTVHGEKPRAVPVGQHATPATATPGASSAASGASSRTTGAAPNPPAAARIQGFVSSFSSGRRTNNMYQTFKHVVRTEGFQALYRPMWPALLMSIPGNVLYFVSYEMGKEWLEQDIVQGGLVRKVSTSLGNVGVGDSSSHDLGASTGGGAQGNKNSADESRGTAASSPSAASSTTSASHLSKTSPPSSTSAFLHAYLPAAAIAGSLARTVTVFCMAPFEIVRTRLGAANYGGVAQTVAELYSTQGLRGYWKGLQPTLLRDVPFSGLYWASYDFLNRKLRTTVCGARPPPSVKTTTSGGEDRDQATGTTGAELVFSFTAGATSGAFASVLSHPFDVLKTQRQVADSNYLVGGSGAAARLGGGTSTLAALRDLQRRGQLFAGLAPRVLRAAPACAIMISSYEYVKRNL